MYIYIYIHIINVVLLISLLKRETNIFSLEIPGTLKLTCLRTREWMLGIRSFPFGMAHFQELCYCNFWEGIFFFQDSALCLFRFFFDSWRGLNRRDKYPCGFCFVEYYTHAGARGMLRDIVHERLGGQTHRFNSKTETLSPWKTLFLGGLSMAKDKKYIDADMYMYICICIYVYIYIYIYLFLSDSLPFSLGWSVVVFQQ